ncbi:MAG: ABC transporter permease [Saezia sp.]
MNQLSSTPPIQEQEIRAAISVPVETPWVRFVREYSASKIALLALFFLLLTFFVAIFAPWIAPQNPYDLASLDFFDSKLPPSSVSEFSQMTYWLGTDSQGRDMLSAIFYGLRTSLTVGFVSVGISLTIGCIVGMVAAYFGGWIDSLLMRIVDIQLSFPSILIALILLAVWGQGVDKVIFALIIAQWAYFARAARGSALVERSKEYIEAAQCMSLGSMRILLRHLLPNCLPPLIVIATINVAHAITLEATLSFLGVGVPVTEPSLGMLIKDGFEYMQSGFYWISFFPGIALAIAIISINLVGDQLRDVLNPHNSN